MKESTMTDEQSKKPSGGKKRRRRRSSRKRKRSSQAKGDANKGPTNQSGDDSNSTRSSRRRRRRRRRSRGKGSSNQRQQQVAAKDMLDAKLPESIFVYTHVVRSSELDTYGFRSDPFMNRSRSLDDFRIDLSPIFPDAEEDGEAAEVRIFDAALHSQIVISLEESDDTDDGENDTEQAAASLDEATQAEQDGLQDKGEA
jgi:hypothetical protein